MRPPLAEDEARAEASRGIFLTNEFEVGDEALVIAVGHTSAQHGYIVSAFTVRDKRMFPNNYSVVPYDVGMLDLNRLRIFRSVVANGSVNDAARLLGYTPSTVSQHVHTLEREVGFPLVERVGRGIRPTAAGISLATASSPVLEAMAQLEAQARDLRQGASTRLTVRSFASAAYTWMPAVARTLRVEYPEVAFELSINEADTSEDPGQADIEVHTELPSEPVQAPPAYARIELALDDFLVALPPDHPKVGANTIDLAEFAQDDWVQYDFRDPMATRIYEQACAQAGFTPRLAARAQDHVTGLAFVAAGVGIALVPQLALRWSGFDVAYVHPINPTPQRRIVGLVRDGVRNNAAAMRALGVLAELGRKLTR